MPSNQPPNGPGPSLKRVLGLPALILYGIILIQPTAPMPLFGAAAVEAKGHVVTIILIGMVAMLFTAVGYGRMANAYPSAGSAYAYVSREIHPAPGYLVGWGMIFDYVMNPIICVIWCSEAARNILLLPFWIYAVSFTVLFTGMNLRGIEASSRTNAVIAAGLGVVIVLFLGAAVRYLWLHPPGGVAGWSQPFYDPRTFTFRTMSGGAALAVLTYIGFDGISTLSEEVHNPRRNILLATVLVCLLTGVLASIQVYSAQLLRPGYGFSEAEAERAFAHVAAIAGGAAISFAITITLLIATIGSGMGAQLGAARLLYGMGRSNAIPKSFFGALDPRTRIPRNNVIAVGVVALVGAYIIRDYDRAAELLNYGALIAFMGVNIASLTHYFIRGANRSLSNLLVPLCGFFICGALWLNLSKMALIAGSIWMFAGVAYGAVKTRGFQADLVNFDVPAE